MKSLGDTIFYRIPSLLAVAIKFLVNVHLKIERRITGDLKARQTDKILLGYCLIRTYLILRDE